ncbi:unnamed protein product [Sympodiomycopsis kandeliae]
MDSATISKINTTLPLAELDELPLVSRHRLLAKTVRATDFETVHLSHIVKSQLRSADVAFLIRSTHRLDWAIDALCTFDNGSRPLALLDTRIETAAIHVFCKHWNSKHQGASKLLNLIEERYKQLGDENNGQDSSVSNCCLHRLYNSLCPMGRKTLAALIVKNIPSIGVFDSRTHAYDEIVRSYLEDLTGLLDSHLQIILPYSSSGVVDQVLSALQPHQIDLVNDVTWSMLCERHTSLTTSFLKNNVASLGEVAFQVIVPALCSNRTPLQPSPSAPLVTEGQRFFHEVYSGSGPLRSDNGLIHNFQAAIGTLQHLSRKSPQDLQTYRSAVLYLFKQHIATDVAVNRKSYAARLKTSILVKVIRWLHNRRQGGDLEAAAIGIQQLGWGNPESLTVPDGWRRFPPSLRLHVFTQANQIVIRGHSAGPEETWQEFLNRLPERKKLAKPNVLLALPQTSSRELLAKVGASNIDWSSARYSTASEPSAIGDPIYQPFALFKQKAYAEQLLMMCLPPSYASTISEEDYDKRTQEQICATVFKILLGDQDGMVKAHELVADLHQRRSKSSQTRGHFTAVALALALACQDTQMIKTTFEKVLKQCLRDSGARQQCMISSSSCLDVDVLAHTLASRHPETGDACLVALESFIFQRSKEPDYHESSESMIFAGFVGRVFFKRVRTLLSRSNVEATDVDRLLAVPLKLWMQVRAAVIADHPKIPANHHSGTLCLPSSLNPTWEAFGKWTDRFFSENKRCPWNFLPWKWQSEGGSIGLESLSPVLADLIWSEIRSSMDLEDGQRAALHALLACCGGPQEGIEVMRKLWNSEEGQLKQIAVQTLMAEQSSRRHTSGYFFASRRPKNLERLLKWNFESQNFIQELFEQGPDGMTKLFTGKAHPTKQMEKDAWASGAPFWRGICLERKASVKVHRRAFDAFVFNQERLMTLLKWGSIDPTEVEVADPDGSSLDNNKYDTLHALATSTNPSVARQHAIDVLRFGDASAAHRHIALNPKTLNRLPPAAAKAWVDEAMNLALTRLEKAKVTTAKALIHFAFSCTSLSVKERVTLAHRVVERVQHADVKRSFAGVLMFRFWRQGSDDQIKSHLAELTSTDDKAIQAELLTPATVSGLNLAIRKEEEVMRFIQVVVGPVLETAWRSRRTQIESLLEIKDIPVMESGVELWTAPHALLMQMSSNNRTFLIGLAFEHPGVAGCQVITDCLSKGLVRNRQAVMDSFRALNSAGKAVRESSADLAEFYDWSLRAERQSILWSCLSVEGIFLHSVRRNWLSGADRVLELLERIALSRIEEYHVVQSVIGTCVRAILHAKCEAKDEARKVAEAVLSAARAEGSYEIPKVFALEWQAIPLARSKVDSTTCATVDEQLDIASDLLRKLFDGMGGYICSKELIDLHRPFHSCFSSNDSSVGLKLTRRMIEQACQLCSQESRLEKEFGFFCLQQALQWLKSSYIDEENQQLLKEMMAKDYCNDATWSRLLGMNFRWNSYKKTWEKRNVS